MIKKKEDPLENQKRQNKHISKHQCDWTFQMRIPLVCLNKKGFVSFLRGPRNKMQIQTNKQEEGSHYGNFSLVDKGLHNDPRTAGARTVYTVKKKGKAVCN